jgi:HEPN domain-containing protein
MARIGMECNGPPVTVVFLLQQAVEKYLKGYIIWNSDRLTKTHNLELLIDQASAFNRSLSAYVDLGRRLTATYTLERYPPGPRLAPEPEEVLYILEQVKRLIEVIVNEFEGNRHTLGG